MQAWRSRWLFGVLLPTIALSAGALAYYTWQTALQHARLGEEAIVESTLLLVREKVDEVEQWIIRQDNAVFALVDPTEPRAIEETWPPLAEDLSPSVKAVVIVDASGRIVAFSMRDSLQAQRDFERLLSSHVLDDLKLGELPVDSLRHLHRTYDGRPYLFSYVSFAQDGVRIHAIAHHDTGYIARTQLPQLFTSEEGREQFNVVDANNHRIYGPSLADAGDYLVGRRFPTTLYEWRLQVAPKQAPLLGAQARSRWRVEIALVSTALAVMLLGIAYILFAAIQDRRLNALKAEFVANVSHELKTPLSVIRMFGEMLESGRVRDEEKRGEYASIICRESERLTALIENVLDFAAVERGRRMYDFHERDVGEIVRRALDAFRHRAERAGLQVKLEIAPALPKIAVDDQALLLAVVNLLDNAAKYGNRSPIDLTVNQVSDAIVIRVRDRGPGIAPEELRHIFERFYRGKEAKRARGSGIGLSLVKSIAEAHGGSTQASNAPEGGAEVCIILPIPTAGEH